MFRAIISARRSLGRAAQRQRRVHHLCLRLFLRLVYYYRLLIEYL